MNTPLRRATVSVALAALVSYAFGAGPASSETSTDLPSLTLGEVLEIARVEAPPAGIGLEVHMDFPVENPLRIGDRAFTALSAFIDPDRSVHVQNAIAADRTNRAASAEADECIDPTFSPTGRRWALKDMPVRWRFNRGSTPPGNSIYRTQTALRAAHTVWPITNSDCTNRDEIDFAYEFAGLTERSVKYDGTNIVKFCPLGRGALAVNYSWVAGTRILEADLCLNRNDYNWTNRPGGRRYQVVNVAAHELGHQIGLNDLGDPHGGLTMFGRITRGEMKKTTLGQGDIRGAGRLSP